MIYNIILQLDFFCDRLHVEIYLIIFFLNWKPHANWKPHERDGELEIERNVIFPNHRPRVPSILRRRAPTGY